MLSPFDQILTQDSFGMFTPLKELTLEKKHYLVTVQYCDEGTVDEGRYQTDIEVEAYSDGDAEDVALMMDNVTAVLKVQEVAS